MAKWEDIAGNPRFLSLGPDEQNRVRAAFDKKQRGTAGEGMPGYQRGRVRVEDDGEGAPAPPERAGWVNDLSSGEQEGLRSELKGLPPLERAERIGLATRRLVRDDDGRVTPRPQGEPMTTSERLMAEAAPVFRGAAAAQTAVDDTFKAGGDYVTQHSQPYLEKVLPPSAARLASRLAGGAVEYLPYTPLLGGEEGAAEVGAGAGRLLSRLGPAAARSAKAGLRFGAVEAERTAAHALNDRRDLEPGELGEAATEGFVGGAGGHAALSEVGLPLARSAGRLARRLGTPATPAPRVGAADFAVTPGGEAVPRDAGRIPFASDAELEASAKAGDDAAREALRLRGLGKPAGSVSPTAGEDTPLSLAGEVSVPGGTPAAHGAPQATATAESNLAAPARPADPSTALAVSRTQAAPPEIIEARTMSQRAMMRGDAESAAEWSNVADEIERRWKNPTQHVIGSASRLQIEGPADRGPAIRVTPGGDALLPGQPGGDALPGMTSPVPSSTMRMPPGGAQPRTPPGQPSAEQLAAASRVRNLPSDPGQRSGMTSVMAQASAAIEEGKLPASEQAARASSFAEQRAQARLRARLQPTPEQPMLPEPGATETPMQPPLPANQSLVPSRTMAVTPGASPGGGMVMPPGARIPDRAPMTEPTPDMIRAMLRLRNRGLTPPGGGAAPPGPTEGSTRPAPVEPPTPIAENASGESAASQEAISRVRTEKRTGTRRLRVDTRTGKATPLVGVDAVDVPAGPHDVIVKDGPRGREVISTGNRVSKQAVERVKGAKSAPVIPTEVEQVAEGKARAWIRPPAAENTRPTAGEQAMTGVDLADFAKSRGLGHYVGADGTEVLYDPRQVSHADLQLRDRAGQLAELVNGDGTSPKPVAPTHAVTTRNAEGDEVRTVLTDSPETTRAAVAAAPEESPVEVHPVEAVPELIADRAHAGERVANAAAHDVEPTPDVRKGKTQRVVTPKYPDTRTQFEVVDLDDLRASHSGVDFTPKPDYPQAVQPRNRESMPNRQAITEGAAKLDPEQLGASVQAAHGAPIVGPDNVAESGNGRVMKFERAREMHPAEWTKYQAWLRDNIDQFGMTSEALKGVKNPVLVQRRLTPMDAATRADFAADTNVGTIAQMGASEQARADARRLTPDIVGTLDVPESGDLAAPSNRAFARAFVKATVAPSERNTFLTTDGDLSTTGVKRLRDALLAHVFDDPASASMIDRMTSATDDQARNISGAIVRALPSLAKMKALAQKGVMLDRDITRPLAEAAEVASGLRERAQSIRDFLHQNEMFSQRDPMVDSMLDLFDRHGRSQKKIAEALTNFVDMVEQLGDQRQGEMGGAKKPMPSVRDLWGEAKASIEDQATLFGPGKPQPTMQRQVGVVTKKLRAQIAAAEAAGEHDVAGNLKAKLKLVEEGFNPDMGGPGAASVGEFADRAVAALKAAGSRDPRVKVETLDDKPEILTYLAGPGFVFRNHPVMRRAVALLQRGIDNTDRLHRMLLERGPQAGIEASGGWRSIERLIPKGEVEKFRDLAWQGDAEERLLTHDELRAGGLSDGSIAAYDRMHGLLDYARRHLVNPLRADMGLPPLEEKAGYLPHRWFGSYDVYVNGEREMTSGPGGVSSVATLSDAYRWAAKLITEGKLDADADVQIKPRYREFTRELPDVAESRALQALLTRLEDSGTVSKDDIVAAYKAGVRPGGFPRHLEHRRGVLGFEKERLLGEDGIVDRYLSELARYVPMKRATETVKTIMADVDGAKSPALFQAMNRLLSRVQGKPGAAEVFLDNTLKNIPILGQYINPNRPTMAAVRNIRNVVSHLKLGLGNVSAGIVNSLQFVTHASPILGPEYATYGARAALMPSEAEARLMMRFEHLGLLEPMYIRGELAGTEGKLHRIGNAMFYPMTAAERFNRRATLMGAYKRLNDLGTSAKGDRLVRLASDFTRERLDEVNTRVLGDTARRISELTNFRYDVASRPAFTTGPVGELVGQFRTFTIGTMELQKRLFDLARKGDPAPFLAHAGAIAALSGVLGFPFAYLIDDVVRGLSGTSPIDEVTKRAPAWATRGLPALAGVDISRRVGMGDVTPQQFQDLAGPAVGTFLSVLQQLHAHDLDMLARRTATGPGALYTLFRDMSDGAEREPSSRKRMRFQPGGVDLFWRAVGFQPIASTELSDTIRMTRRDEASYKEHRANSIDDAVKARNAGDHSRMFEIIRESKASGAPITFHDVLHEAKQKETPTIERLYKSLPKPLRAQERDRFNEEASRQRLLKRFR